LFLSSQEIETKVNSLTSAFLATTGKKPSPDDQRNAQDLADLVSSALQNLRLIAASLSRIAERAVETAMWNAALDAAADRLESLGHPSLAHETRTLRR